MAGDEVVRWLRAFSRARDEFLSSSVTRLPPPAGLIRPTVHASWRRSRLQGLDPDEVEPHHLDDVDSDHYLARAVAPVVNRREVALEHGAYALVLTDRDGRLLHRWVKAPRLAEAMDALGVAPGTTMDESVVGTTALVTMLTGSPEMIRGPEHYSDRLRDFTCASAPIVHPINRRLLGSISLVCRLRDTAPVMLPWVTEIVAAVEEGLRLRSARREQQLFDAYTRHNRDARHPVVALDSSTIITNAAAARLLSGVDQSMLWEHARRTLVGPSGPSTLTLPNGHVVSVDCRAVSDDEDDAGAVLLITRRAVPSTVDDTCAITGTERGLPRLTGRSQHWQALCQQVIALRGVRSSVLVTGEPGTGRLSVAQALQGWQDVRVLDAADAASRGRRGWCRALEAELDGVDASLVIRHVDLLDPALAQATLATLRRVPPARLLATADRSIHGTSRPNALLDSFAAVVEVPPLRDRLDDLHDLVAAFTDRAGGRGRVEWTPEAIQTLSRVDWPGNLNSVDALVRRLVADTAGGRRRITVEHLPPEYLARGARRPLATLEQTEATAILNALRAAGGNKNQAALALGIARSTLYRKVRALGLDLTTTVY
ncbi:sigma-54-dependent Fis family transcriptional regulator [Actinomycetospora lemnae]|uniref:Helix-turn-helix domain-containing protein n=1 Tax=Actinomycetospora lemnae TaxID=3019891 RepID=A0ABT5SUP9_9PSEU|nr:helix-turn-helix domain-containing protein [Actinomycetospora sp. DW7H6]MDD7965463.1 helix-turn-helix domain-containing protein [Actinomycetospora sp. DW7H6]